MDEEMKKKLMQAILDRLLAPEPAPLNIEVQPSIEEADTLGEVLINHNISLASKKFIVIADSAEDSTQCVSVLQVEKDTLRDIINKLIRAYKQLDAYEAKEKQDV